MASVLRRRPALQPVSVRARWLGDIGPGHLDRGSAVLELAARTAKGPVAACYWVKRLAGPGGRTEGYRLAKFASAEAHDVDVSFGPAAEAWSCDCGDYCWRSSVRPGGGCKHTVGLAQALKEVGHAADRA
jgi:hypothetical protein